MCKLHWSRQSAFAKRRVYPRATIEEDPIQGEAADGRSGPMENSPVAGLGFVYTHMQARKPRAA